LLLQASLTLANQNYFNIPFKNDPFYSEKATIRYQFINHQPATVGFEALSELPLQRTSEREAGYLLENSKKLTCLIKLSSLYVENRNSHIVPGVGMSCFVDEQALSL